MSRALVVFGTRPEAVKLAPIILELARWGPLEPITCVTGQHRDMVDHVLGLFAIRPAIDLGIMRDDQSPSDVTARVLLEVTRLIGELDPALVLIQGDTSSALGAAMAGFLNRVPVGHVEAGLRTRSVREPFPEEMNRRVITTLSTLHFAPTVTARDALLREGTPADRVYLTGNTVVDAFSEILPRLDPVNVRGDTSRKMLLVTAHRRENFGPRLEGICAALRRLADTRDDVEIVYPVHPNPRVSKPVHRLLDGLRGVSLVQPLAYADFLRYLRDCYLVLTDSGGVQEEAPLLGKPVLVLRDQTERPEGVAAGVARLVGASCSAIVEAVTSLLDDPGEYARMSARVSPYGDGRAAGRIAQACLAYVEAQAKPSNSPDR